MSAAPIDEVVDLLRTLRLPLMRTAAPDLLATAKAQRWEPAEAMRALLAEELAGRQASSVRARRKAAGFPTGKTFDVWDETLSSIPPPTQRALRTLEWVDRHENLVVCHCPPAGVTEVARHRRGTPGTPVIDDAHYPPRPDGPLARKPKPTSAAEVEFLGIGEGARSWLVEAAAAGTSRVKVKMAEAVTLSRLHGTGRVDWALGHAATFGRFAEGDLASILAANPPGQRRSADDVHSLQPGTGAWHQLGGDR